MTSKEYIKQQIAVGYDIHFHDGIWWLNVAPSFCMPVNPLEVIEFGKAKPKMNKSLMGYKHLVSNSKFANKYWSVLLLNNERLIDFGMQKLSSSKRAQVRKGLKLTEIRKIENIEPVLDDMKNICISAATRTKHAKPPEYYVEKYSKWSSFIRNLFNFTTGEWWGSFYNGSMIAYIYAYQIDDAMFLDAFKSHTDTLDKCPNDALLFSFLTYCNKLGNCNKVIFGDWSDNTPSLNAFKQKYGFEKMDLPVHAEYNFLISIVKKIKYFGNVIF